MSVRAIRGATQVAADDRDEVLAATRVLIGEVMARNALKPDDLISVLFTATPDLRSVAPALAARQLGLNDVALICVQEQDVDGSMPRVVRLMAHVDSDVPREDVVNVYLNGTHALRDGVPPVPGA